MKNNDDAIYFNPMTDNNEELFPIIDDNANIIGSATRRECHNGSKMLHPVVHLHVTNSKGQLYLQKRPKWKDIQPDKWDTAVGGHVSLGENVEMALHREAKEELGIEGFKPNFIDRYIFESQKEKEFVFSYMTVFDGIIVPSSELEEGKFWDLSEIKESLGKGFFTPNFEKEFKEYYNKGYFKLDNEK